MPHFAHNYVINLRRRPERWKRALQQLAASGFDPSCIKRVEAVDGPELFRKDRLFLKSIVTDSAYEEIQERKRSYYEQLTLGAVGCTLSHISVWKEIVTKGIPESLIFEDDIIFSKNFKVLFPERWPMVPEDRDLVFLGCWHRRKPIGVDRYVVRPTNIFWTHAYALSRQGAEILLENVFPLKLQLDAYISGMFSSLRAYALRPALVRQSYLKWFDTDVQVPVRRFYDLRSLFMRMNLKD